MLEIQRSSSKAVAGSLEEIAGAQRFKSTSNNELLPGTHVLAAITSINANYLTVSTPGINVAKIPSEMVEGRPDQYRIGEMILVRMNAHDVGSNLCASLFPEEKLLISSQPGTVFSATVISEEPHGYLMCVSQAVNAFVKSAISLKPGRAYLVELTSKDGPILQGSIVNRTAPFNVPHEVTNFDSLQPGTLVSIKKSNDGSYKANSRFTAQIPVEHMGSLELSGSSVGCVIKLNTNNVQLVISCLPSVISCHNTSSGTIIGKAVTQQFRLTDLPKCFFSDSHFRVMLKSRGKPVQSAFDGHAAVRIASYDRLADCYVSFIDDGCIVSSKQLDIGQKVLVQITSEHSWGYECKVENGTIHGVIYSYLTKGGKQKLQGSIEAYVYCINPKLILSSVSFQGPSKNYLHGFVTSIDDSLTVLLPGGSKAIVNNDDYALACTKSLQSSSLRVGSYTPILLKQSLEISDTDPEKPFSIYAKLPCEVPAVLIPYSSSHGLPNFTQFLESKESMIEETFLESYVNPQNAPLNKAVKVYPFKVFESAILGVAVWKSKSASINGRYGDMSVLKAAIPGKLASKINLEVLETTFPVLPGDLYILETFSIVQHGYYTRVGTSIEEKGALIVQGKISDKDAIRLTLQAGYKTVQVLSKHLKDKYFALSKGDYLQVAFRLDRPWGRRFPPSVLPVEFMANPLQYLTVNYLTSSECISSLDFSPILRELAILNKSTKISEVCEEISKGYEVNLIKEYEKIALDGSSQKLNICRSDPKLPHLTSLARNLKKLDIELTSDIIKSFQYSTNSQRFIDTLRTTLRNNGYLANQEDLPKLFVSSTIHDSFNIRELVVNLLEDELIHKAIAASSTPRILGSSNKILEITNPSISHNIQIGNIIQGTVVRAGESGLELVSSEFPHSSFSASPEWVEIHTSYGAISFSDIQAANLLENSETCVEELLKRPWLSDPILCSNLTRLPDLMLGLELPMVVVDVSHDSIEVSLCHCHINSLSKKNTSSIIVAEQVNSNNNFGVFIGDVGGCYLGCKIFQPVQSWNHIPTVCCKVRGKSHDEAKTLTSNKYTYNSLLELVNHNTVSILPSNMCLAAENNQRGAPDALSNEYICPVAILPWQSGAAKPILKPIFQVLSKISDGSVARSRLRAILRTTRTTMKIVQKGIVIPSISLSPPLLDSTCFVGRVTSLIMDGIVNVSVSISGVQHVLKLCYNSICDEELLDIIAFGGAIAIPTIGHLLKPGHLLTLNISDCDTKLNKCIKSHVIPCIGKQGNSLVSLLHGIEGSLDLDSLPVFLENTADITVDRDLSDLKIPTSGKAYYDSYTKVSNWLLDQSTKTNSIYVTNDSSPIVGVSFIQEEELSSSDIEASELSSDDDEEELTSIETIKENIIVEETEPKKSTFWKDQLVNQSISRKVIRDLPKDDSLLKICDEMIQLDMKPSTRATLLHLLLGDQGSTTYYHAVRKGIMKAVSVFLHSVSIIMESGEAKIHQLNKVAISIEVLEQVLVLQQFIPKHYRLSCDLLEAVATKLSQKWKSSSKNVGRFLSTWFETEKGTVAINLPPPGNENSCKAANLYHYMSQARNMAITSCSLPLRLMSHEGQLKIRLKNAFGRQYPSSSAKLLYCCGSDPNWVRLSMTSSMKTGVEVLLNHSTLVNITGPPCIIMCHHKKVANRDIVLHSSFGTNLSELLFSPCPRRPKSPHDVYRDLNLQGLFRVTSNRPLQTSSDMYSLRNWVIAAGSFGGASARIGITDIDLNSLNSAIEKICFALSNNYLIDDYKCLDSENVFLNIFNNSQAKAIKHDIVDNPILELKNMYSNNTNFLSELSYQLIINYFQYGSLHDCQAYEIVIKQDCFPQLVCRTSVCCTSLLRDEASSGVVYELFPEHCNVAFLHGSYAMLKYSDLTAKDRKSLFIGKVINNLWIESNKGSVVVSQRSTEQSLTPGALEWLRTISLDLEVRFDTIRSNLQGIFGISELGIPVHVPYLKRGISGKRDITKGEKLHGYITHIPTSTPTQANPLLLTTIQRRSNRIENSENIESVNIKKNNALLIDFNDESSESEEENITKLDDSKEFSEGVMNTIVNENRSYCKPFSSKDQLRSNIQIPEGKNYNTESVANLILNSIHKNNIKTQSLNDEIIEKTDTLIKETLEPDTKKYFIECTKSSSLITNDSSIKTLSSESDSTDKSEYIPSNVLPTEKVSINDSDKSIFPESDSMKCQKRKLNDFKKGEKRMKLSDSDEIDIENKKYKTTESSIKPEIPKKNKTILAAVKETESLERELIRKAHDRSRKERSKLLESNIDTKNPGRDIHGALLKSGTRSCDITQTKKYDKYGKSSKIFPSLKDKRSVSFNKDRSGQRDFKKYSSSKFNQRNARK